MLFKLMELISCNTGTIEQTVTFQEHVLKILKGGLHLPLLFQSVDPMCCITCHQNNSVLIGLEGWLLISSHIFKAEHNVVLFKGGEPRTGLLSLTRKMLGFCQLGRYGNSSSGSHDHTCARLYTRLHKIRFLLRGTVMQHRSQNHLCKLGVIVSRIKARIRLSTS